MGSHKRSFQCFDAILDDPSIKPSLSYGHWSAASHTGSPGSNQLEPLEDRRCYLCANHQQAAAMTSEASGAYSAPWYHFQSHPHAHQHMTRRPTRPEKAPEEAEDRQHYQHHRQSRRIVLVKNSDPSVRRTIVLHHRSLRSLGLFMDEVSELMQFLIRKLYTLDGRKVDSMQSLLQCAGILVCVGREPFHPLLLDSFRKNSHDKLPKLNIKSRSSVGSDEKAGKKNVNFGLETKQSGIPPRCDSRNRSARLRMSSEKLFPNALNSLPPAREGMMDDDIEKRVLVNKDGSLSMEMKVRFRLLHDETLHWSTEIKKSMSTSNESHESLSAGEAEETYNTKRYQRHFEEPHCQHCCAQCQEYDIWKNPILLDQTAVRHIKSSSSSASSRRIVCKQASTDSVRTISSEEYIEHVVEKATCIEQTFGQQGNTMVEHCTINCCCRQSEVCSMSSKTKTTGSTEEKSGMTEKAQTSDNDRNWPDNSKDSQKEQLSVQITQPMVEEERPVSTVSASSQILASLKEDQDEEDLEFPSISRVSHDNGQQEDEDRKGAESNPCSDTTCRSSASMTHLSPRPPSKASSLGRSKTSRKFTPTEIDVDQGNQNVRPGSAESALSKALSGPKKCKSLDSKDTVPPMALENDDFMANDQTVKVVEPKTDAGIEERPPSEMSAKCKISTKSIPKSSDCSQDDIAAEGAQEHNRITEERSSSAVSIKSHTSGKSSKSNVTDVHEQEYSAIQDGRAASDISTMSQTSEDQETELRTSSAMSGKSDISAKSRLSKEPQSEETEGAEGEIEDRASNVKSVMSNRSGIEELTNDEFIEEGASSAISLKSNMSDRSKMSIELVEFEEQERASSRVSVKSYVSQKSKSEISEADSFQEGKEEGELQDRTASGVSATSFQSTLSDVLPAMTVQPHDGEEKERTQSAMSAKSDVSVKLDAPGAKAVPQVDNVLPGERCLSSMSSKSNISATAKVSDGDQEQIKAQDEEENQETASSAISAKSTTSSRSRKSEATPTATERSEQEIKDELPLEQRASSAMLAKSHVSATSKRSKMSEVAGDEHTKLQDEDDDRLSAVSHSSEMLNTSNECGTADEEKDKRTPSALSTNSNNSVKSEKFKANDLAVDIVSEEHRADLRSASAMSFKSNVSAKSVKSEVSELDIEEPVETEDQNEGRAQGALSTKSNQSEISENVTDEVDVAEDRAQSIVSSKSNASERSEKSNISKVTASLTQGADHQTEERAQSALSAKSSVSVNASATAVEADDKKKEDRAPSAMSGRSHISTKSNISAKSKTSKISEISPQEPEDEEREGRTPSVMSTKSSVSARSNKSKCSELVHGDAAEVHNKDRSPSAISSNSNTSTKSRRSIISEATPKKNEITTEGEIKERALSAMSAKSNSSVRTRTSKVSDIIIDEPNQQNIERASSSRSFKSDVSGRSKKSNVIEAGPEDLVNEDKDKEERTASVLSSISNVSARSIKSRDSGIIPGAPDVTGSNVEERVPSIASVTSSRSKRSNISGVASEGTEMTGNGDVEASVKSSSVLAQSNDSTKSKKSLLSEAEEPDERSTSVVSRASAAFKADVEKKSNRSPSQLSAKSNASARSKKSNVSWAEDHGNTPTNNKQMEFTRDKSPVAGHSNVSQAVQSNKCVCGAINKPLNPMVSSEKDSDHEEIPLSPLSTKSAKSKISLNSERVLTPTSTSVSIWIVDDCEADNGETIEEDAVSVNSRTSALSQTEICADKGLLESPVQITNERATQTPEERPESFTSAKSNISDKSKTKCSHCSSTLPTDTAFDTNQRDEVTSNVSSKTKNLMTSSDSHPSANCSVRQSSSTQEIRSSSKASNVSVHSCKGISAEKTAVTGQGAAESPGVTHKSQSICSKYSSLQIRGKTSTGLVAPVSPVSSASAVSDSGKSRKKARNTPEMIVRPNSNISNSSSLRQINYQKINMEATVSNEDGHSGKSNTSCNKSTKKNEEDMDRCHSATLSVTSGNPLSPSPPKSPQKNKKPVILLRGSNESALSQTVPIPDKREQNADNLNTELKEPKSNRPDRTYNGLLKTTDCIPNVSDSKSEKSSKCRKRTGSSSSCPKINDDISEISPSCLPNASPTEVVNEWLRKIPSDTALCDLGDEFLENFDAIEPLCTSHMPSGQENEHESSEEHDVTKLEKQDKLEDPHLPSEEGAIDKKGQENHAACEDRQCIRTQAGDEPKVLDSSVLVMKVLLSPRLDRCNSLPEVSPVYGRKLSTSAQGLLDCLAKLQLLDFGPNDENSKKAKYPELMSMLKSLWLCDPKDTERISKTRKSKDQQPQDEEFKARSSSGVDVNSGSPSSGKSSVLDGTQAQTNTECEGPDTLTKVQEVDETVEEEASETPESKCDSATPDIASRARWTPEGGAKGPVKKKLKDDVPGSDETIRNNNSPRELMETPPSSNINSVNNPKNKEIETDHQEDTSSGSTPAPQRPQLSKRVSQDPDPIWVLNLLNKLEKQFMRHYVNAMDEFKVRWNLDDNEQLDIMICELQDEVRRRIQSSVDRELKKIQGRAGRPRPPKEAMSCESTVQTEQRRRRLKVMRNQSIDPQPQKSDDDYTASGTDFSDQRSDDEYCPCDTCLKKKMASKPVLPVEMLNSAPVMMDFDLRRILQIKKSAPNNEKMKEIASKCKFCKLENLEKNVALEAVKEEDKMEGTENLEKSRESEEGEKDENASSADEDDTTGKQSDRSGNLKTDMNEEVEVISSTEVVEVEEIAEISDNLMAEQNKEGEKDDDKEKRDDAEADSNIAAVNESSPGESDNISEDAEDTKQVESEQEKAKEKASEEHTEESEEEGEMTEGEISGGGNAKADTAEEGKTVEDEQTETAGESETPEDETEEESEAAKNKTAGESETPEDETAEEDETVEYKTAEESETVEAETAEESETAEDKTAEENETVEAETAEESEIAEDKIAEENETVEAETAEEGETAENETGEDGVTIKSESTNEDETVEDGQNTEIAVEDGKTSDNDIVEEGDTANDETSEDGQNAHGTEEENETADDNIAEEGKTANTEYTEKGETADNETTVEGQTAEAEISGEDEATDDETAEKDETAEDKTLEDEQTAEVETAGEDEIAEDETAEEGETVNVETAEKSETSEDKTSEDGQTAEEDETANDDTAKDGQTAEVETEKDGETVYDDTAEDGQTAEVEIEEEGEAANDDTEEERETSVNESVEEAKAGESETAEDEIATDGESAEIDSAEEGKTAVDETAEDEQNVKSAAGEGETAENDTAEEGETAEDEAIEDEQTTEAETAEESETVDEERPAEKDNSQGETVDENSVENEDDLLEETADEKADEAESDGHVAGDHTDDVETAEGMSAEEKQTSEAETVDEETTEAEMSEEKSTVEDATATAEGDLTVDEKNAEEELAGKRKMSDNGTGGEDTAESQSELEEVKETVGHEEDILSNPEETGCDDVIELKADEEVADKETPFENNGDVVIDSIEEKDKESGKEDDVEEILGDKGHHYADIGESAEGGDEAEDDTDPDMEIDEGEHDGKVQALQTILQSKQDDDQLDKPTVTSFDAVVNHNSVYDADVEDSETEVHNQVQDLSSESKSKPHSKTARKTFKMLIHTLTFLKSTATERPKVREEEDGDDEDEVTPEGSFNAEDSSCVEKDECEEVDEKEKGKLSDITENTAEEDDQKHETGNTTKDYSEDNEWESSENTLEKQFTKSSMESQPGSFDEVLDDQIKSQKGLNHVTVKANR